MQEREMAKASRFLGEYPSDVHTGKVPQLTKTAGVLMEQIARLEGQLNEAHDAAHQIDMALTRLREPTPEKPSGVAECVTPSSLEGKLNALSQSLSGLINRLSQAANVLNSSV